MNLAVIGAGAWGTAFEGRGNVTATMAAYIDLNPVRAGLRARTRPRPLPNITDWGDITTLRNLRKQPLG